MFSFASSCIFCCQASETQGTTITCGVTLEIVVKRNQTKVSHPLFCQSSNASSPHDTHLPYFSASPTFTLFATLSIPSCSPRSSTSNPTPDPQTRSTISIFLLTIPQLHITHNYLNRSSVSLPARFPGRFRQGRILKMKKGGKTYSIISTRSRFVGVGRGGP